ncbi:MAG TPA: HAD-IA family hydrolase [Candidatus Paceibacterota bacterium]|nr:HAD-IA family hydrolase [Candidatus Paceibacterota bacterium]
MAKGIISCYLAKDMQQKIALFDFDGTIADSTEAAVKAYNKVAEQNNLKTMSKEELALLRAMGAREAVRYFDTPLWKLPFIVRKVRAALKNEMSHIAAIPGMIEALRALKEKGHRLFIVSTNSKENIKLFLDRNGIAEFDGIYPVLGVFGKHVKIKQLIQANGWNRGSVAYIGDEVRDIEAAKRAGVLSVAVTWGHNTEEVLLQSGADLVCRLPSDLTFL